MTVRPASSGAARARLRATVALAARMLPVHYPLQSFIAVNPLGGLEEHQFSEALRHAADLYGARGTLPEAAFRRAYAEGRITDGDLAAVLTQRYPEVLAGGAITVGPVQVTPFEMIRAELLHAPSLPGPIRRELTRAERQLPAVAAAVNARAGTWCAAYLGGDARWTMPGRELGLYPAWRQLAGLDRSLPRTLRRELRRLPEHAEDAALDALDRLGIHPDDTEAYLRAHLTSLPGWAAHLRWRSSHRPDAASDMVGYVAMRLTYEALLLGTRDHGAEPARAAEVATEPPPSARERALAVVAAIGVAADPATLDEVAHVLAGYPPSRRMTLWLEAYEHHYRDQLLDWLSPTRPLSPLDRPRAQVVCCIDVRSEGLRRRLEAYGGYETFGFAGFFAVAIRFRELAGGVPTNQCPALIEPGHEVAERAASGAEHAAARRLAGLRALAGAEHAFHAAKTDAISAFALAEAAGWVAGPLAAAKTFAAGPTGALRHRLKRMTAPPAPTDLAVGAFNPEEQILFAQAMLATIGMTRRFARLVVLCGHGSSTENNPYQAALDCGACGGNRGAPNARVAARILNDPGVRVALTARGVQIPQDTWFVAAEHDTATDRTALLDAHTVPASHRDDLARLSADVARAGAALAVERCGALPSAPRRSRHNPGRAARHVKARSSDWAQVYPEWGLAGNAAFVVGPRSLTAELDLERRVFLHSYDSAGDLDGTALETILTAPLVVAQWINCQYYFSTVEPDRFGAGTKTLHNVVGGTGVLSGPDGDLRLGLPWQSLAVGDQLVHEPMRLLAVVQAPLPRIAVIVDRNPVLQRLFGNDWMALVARGDERDTWHRYTTQGWRPWYTSRYDPQPTPHACHTPSPNEVKDTP